MGKKKTRKALEQALWRIYGRSEIPTPWINGGNLPWNDPDFSRRMLREHLDESHGAASRASRERLMLVEKMWSWLGLEKGSRLLDMTCGPGLYAVEFARRGCWVTGVDFAPASIEHALKIAADSGVADGCHFIEQDVRQVNFENQRFDAATFIYGQLAVFSKDDAAALLEKIAAALRPGGRLCVELLNFERYDKKNSTWWYTDEDTLWSDQPFLHLGERFWLEEQQMSIERFEILELKSGSLSTVTLCDQAYPIESMVSMMKNAGFSQVDVYPAWDGVPLYDAQEWIAYVCTV
jgi:SAM-dependent methyltransferase